MGLFKLQIEKPNLQRNNREGGYHLGGGSLSHEPSNLRSSLFSTPTIPPFLDDPSRDQDSPSPIAETVTIWIKEYDTLPPNVKETLAINEYYFIRIKQ